MSYHIIIILLVNIYNTVNTTISHFPINEINMHACDSISSNCHNYKEIVRINRVKYL